MSTVSLEKTLSKQKTNVSVCTPIHITSFSRKVNALFNRTNTMNFRSPLFGVIKKTKLCWFFLCAILCCKSFISDKLYFFVTIRFFANIIQNLGQFFTVKRFTQQCVPMIFVLTVIVNHYSSRFNHSCAMPTKENF